MSKCFFDNYAEYAQATPDKVLLRIDENELTYSDFIKKTAVIGSGMKKLGIGENDKVGICMPNSIEWYLVFWSAVRIGAQPVPMDPQSGSLELSRLIPATTSKIMFISHKYRTNDIIKAVSDLVPEKIQLLRKLFRLTAHTSPQTNSLLSSAAASARYTSPSTSTQCLSPAHQAAQVLLRYSQSPPADFTPHRRIWETTSNSPPMTL